ncbi:MAG: winged helix-turn-helix domain-containing protein [Anaerolineae bacterium]|nr:winged helix-turn-helix domain-containing protein [Anaerolineae bacterium]
MSPIYKEAGFPVYYREAEVRQVMEAVYKLRSIAITGLAGMGKSNVVRFIVSHPQVQARYLKERANDYAFVHVDCAGLADNDEAEILGEIVAQLRRDGLSAGAAQLPQVSHSIRHVLKEQILSVEFNLNLVLVLDYFDQAAAKLDKAFFNYLFHLRNARPQGNLSFIFATRRPLGHLHELQELLDDGCVIGPLSRKDALDSIRRDEARMGCTFDTAQRDKLIACTGGHPGFLKNAGELLPSGEIDVSLPREEIARQLLRSDKVKNLCEELWNDLTPAEQGILLNAARDIPLSKSVDDACVAYLEQSGALVRKKGGQSGLDVAIFCPLFEAFVRERSAVSGTVRITAMFPNQARIETPTGEEWITLSPKLFALLLALTEARGQVLPTDEIISHVYGNEAAGVTNAALAQLVKRLRGLLDPRVRRMTDDLTYTCVETIRDVGYRLNG